MSTETIEITDVGPNARVTLPYLPDGGVVVLRGNNDMGKTEALDAARVAAGGKGRLHPRIGAAGSGSVTAFGAMITVGGSTRRNGEAEVLSLEGRLDLSTLIEPPIKDPEAADKARIKTMLSLTGAEADVTLFYDLLGGKKGFEDIVPADIEQFDDLVGMAGFIKREIEGAARVNARDADNEAGQAQACRAAAGDVDVTQEADADALQAAFQAAVAKDAELKQRAEAADSAAQRAEKARQTLAEHEAEYTGPSSAVAGNQWYEARQEYTTHAALCADAAHALEKAQEALSIAEHTRDSYEAKRDRARERYETALAHEKLLATAKEAMQSATTVEAPSEAASMSATLALTDARKAVEHGALIRQAKLQAVAAKSHHDKAAKLMQRAADLRDAARGTDGILSEAVKCDASRVKDGRLVTDKDGREVYFGDRSKGWRAQVAIDIALERIRKEGEEGRAIVVLPQECWEGLDGKARVGVLMHGRKRKVCVYTGEASRDPNDPGHVRAEVFTVKDN